MEGVLSAWSIEGADLASLACLSHSALGPHGLHGPLVSAVEECCEREALCTVCLMILVVEAMGG